MMPRFTTVTSLPTVERRASNEMERISARRALDGGDTLARSPVQPPRDEHDGDRHWAEPLFARTQTLAAERFPTGVPVTVPGGPSSRRRRGIRP